MKWFASVFPAKNKKETFYTFAFFSHNSVPWPQSLYETVLQKKKTHENWTELPEACSFSQQLDLTKVKPLPHHKQTTQQFVWKRTRTGNTPLLQGPL